MAEDEAQTAPAVDENAKGDSAQQAKSDSAESVSGQPDFGIGPNPEYYVTRPDDIFTQLQSIISTARSGVFGLTGVRGAGKSVLLKKIEKEFKGKHHTLQIPAPVSSKEEAAFFAMLFRQLCRSVITYINTQIFKNKTGVERIAQALVNRRLLGMLILIPLLAAVAYGIWFYGTFYRDYVKEEPLARTVYIQQLNDLTATYELGLANIVNAVKDNILGAARKELREAKDTLSKIENVFMKAQKNFYKAGQAIDDAKGNLDLLYRLRTWERRFSSDFAVWRKGVGDMPHPVHVLIYDRQGFGQGPSFLEEFARRRNTSVPMLEKKLGISVSEAGPLLGDFRNDLTIRNELRRDPRNFDRWFSEINLDGRFSSIQKTLAGLINNQKIARSKALATVAVANKALKEADAALARETEKAAKAASGGANERFKAVEKKAGEEAKNIRDMARPLETAMSRWSDLLKTLKFEFLSPNTWRALHLPSEKLMATATKDKLVSEVEDNHKKFDTDLRNSFKTIAGVAIASSKHMNQLRAATMRLSRLQDRVKTSKISFYEIRGWGAGPLIMGAAVLGLGLFLIAIIYWFIKYLSTRRHRDVLGV
jgi:hypothetical protein